MSARRFYETAQIAERDSAFEILLDGKPAKTRSGKPLAVRTAPLAEAVAGEWNAQGEKIDLATMPLTRLSTTAIDRGDADADAWRKTILSYLRADLLCYRATEPEALVERQRRQWDPLLGWVSMRGVKLQTEAGVAFIEQPPASLAAAEAALAGSSRETLLAMKLAAEIAGSAVIALALANRAFPPEALFAASRVDEDFQAERWGRDREAERRRERMRAEFMDVARYLELLNVRS